MSRKIVRPKRATPRPARAVDASDDSVQATLAWLKQHSTRAILDGMVRYGIPSTHAYGVAVKDIKALGTRLGHNHGLAQALWDTGVYEARMLVSFVADPAQLTAAQMNYWCHGFDNWSICDTLCFNLFDRSPHAWAAVARWSRSDAEFVKRTAFALLWSLSLHDKTSIDLPFIDGLALIEAAATDERNFVKKAVNMALRAVGKHNPALRVAATETARRLADSPDATARWIGKDALRELA